MLRFQIFFIQILISLTCKIGVLLSHISSYFSSTIVIVDFKSHAKSNLLIPPDKLNQYHYRFVTHSELICN